MSEESKGSRTGPESASPASGFAGRGEAGSKLGPVSQKNILTDLCKIPLTMSIENLFPPVPVTEAPVPDESDHVLAFGCVDLGYAYVRDTKENVRRRSSRRSSVDVEAPSGAAAAGGV